MAQLPSQISTVDAGKCDDSRTHLVQHQAPVKTDIKNSVVRLEDSTGNFMPKVSGWQSPLLPASSRASPEIRTGIGKFNCSIYGIGFKDMHALNIHMFTHMQSERTLYSYKGATHDDVRKHFLKGHQRTESESPIEPEQRIIGTYRSHSILMACQQCNFSTNSQEDLTNHYAQMHQSPIKDETKYPIWNDDDDDDDNVRCFVCNQDFPDRGSLAQ